MKGKFLAVVLILSGLFVTANECYAWPQPPSADLTAEPSYVIICDGNVTLDGTGSYDPDNNVTTSCLKKGIKKFEWDFDYHINAGFESDCSETCDVKTCDDIFDGITTHTFSSLGAYTVALRVTDNTSARDIDTCIVHVRPLSVPDDVNTIQEAINMACEGATIEVAKGTYYENINFKGKKITLTSTDPNNAYVVAATIINDDPCDPNANVVTFDSNEDANSILRGFTITGGDRGIYCSSASPTISKCVITNNHSVDNGGGMYCTNSDSPTVTNCVFSKNVADDKGAGMYNNNSSPNVIKCIFIGNYNLNQHYDNGGAGMYNNNSSPNVINCTFSGNFADGCGGGMFNGDSSPNVVSCVFSENEVFYYGGGIENVNSSPTLTNCTFSGNSAYYAGGMDNFDSSPNVTNCIFWGNGNDEIFNYTAACYPTFSYCDINDWDPCLGDGGGNIDSDPNFVNVYNLAGPDGVFGTWDDGLRIMAYSPCVDAANGNVAPETDITGLERINVPYAHHPDHNGTGYPNYADIGAYESPTVWFVDANVSNPNDGSSWDEAFKYLQDALAVAEDGNEIWVAEGIYKPDTNDPNNRAVSFELIEGVDTYGGFAGEMTGPQWRDWTAYNKTILSGDINDIGNPNDNSYHVVIGADRAVLDGFTITNGNADGSYPNSSGGAGIYCSHVSPTIRNCVIMDNRAYQGGGMCNYYCSPTLMNCFFIGNEGCGGGMSNSYSSPTLTNCVFSGNKAVGPGIGGIGGGIRNDPSSSILVNCTFSGNSANSLGGGIGDAHNAIVTNCIFWGNTDCNGTNTDESAQIYGGTPTVTYSCIQDGNPNDANIPFGGAGNNNIDDNPHFADPCDPNGLDDIFGTLDDGLRLTADNNCIDAADGDTAPSKDIIGFPRFDDVNHTGTGDPPYADMGAYEVPPRIVVMCWIDESIEVNGYYGSEENFITDLNNYQDTIKGLLVKSGCLVPSDPNPEDPNYHPIGDVLPDEYEYDPNNPPEGISVKKCNRPPDVNEFKNDFDRIRNGAVPDYLLLVVDNSGSMYTSDINDVNHSYSKFKNWVVNDFGSKIVERKPTYCAGICERWVDEINKGIQNIIRAYDYD